MCFLRLSVSEKLFNFFLNAFNFPNTFVITIISYNISSEAESFLIMPTRILNDTPH